MIINEFENIMEYVDKFLENGKEWFIYLSFVDKMCFQ